MTCLGIKCYLLYCCVLPQYYILRHTVFFCEKTWRNRDGEFKINNPSKAALIELWDEGWKTLLDTIEALEESDLYKKIYIRNMNHTVIEAINRQLTHYAFHVGQIVFIGKLILGKQWYSLSIPLNKSESYNKEKFL